jgi:hypothetical protein
VAAVLVVVGLVLSCCDWCTEPQCRQFVAPVATRAAAAESRLAVVETLVDDLDAAVGDLWDSWDLCCATATRAAETPQPSVTWTAQPGATATGQPSATSTRQLTATATPQPAATATQPAEYYGTRMGVGVGRQFGGMAEYPEVSTWGLGWYFDWWTDAAPARPGGAEYVQTVWAVEQVGLAEAIAANPGALWQIGNEPESAGQGNMTPEEYAAFLRAASEFIKSRDPTARLALGAVSCPTPARLEWLDAVLAAYGGRLPIDVLNVHVWPSPEGVDYGAGVPVGIDPERLTLFSEEDAVDPDVFISMVEGFRSWAHDRGYGDLPLMVSEMGVLAGWTFSPWRIASYMDLVFGWLLFARDDAYGYAPDGGLLVQRWAWFSLNDISQGGALIGGDGSLTVVGDRFMGWLRSW